MAKAKRILLVLPYPMGMAPSQRFRIEQYIPYLEEAGFQINHHCFLTESSFRNLYRSGSIFSKIFGILGGFLRRWTLMFRLGKYSKVYLLREAAPLGPPIYEWWMAKLAGKKIVFDYDDALWLKQASGSNKLVSMFKFSKKTASICKWSSKIIAGNDYLADFARKYNSNVEVIPTVVDTERSHNTMQKHEATPNFGWTGSHSTLPYLDEIKDVIVETLDEFTDSKFYLICNKKPDWDHERLVYINWTEEKEVEDLLNFHVGIMPLPDNDWTKGKCGFKAIQYLSLGIPAIVSPVGVNPEIVKEGSNGYLCSTKEEWKLRLQELLNNAGKRAEMGRQGYWDVRERYSVGAWKEAMERAVNSEQ